MTNLTRPAAALKSAEEIAILETVRAFLYKEARLLDERQFDEWLQCYHPDAEFWMPAWDVDDRLTEDPQNEISLIYYDNRGGIEDRVFRIKTDRS
jgi:benzoate/toluate 1,2-dioxygenase beta subunit